jgi:type II secretory pathway component PulJ
MRPTDRLRSASRRLGVEDGISMTEVLIVMVLLGVVAAALLSGLASMQKSVATAESRSRRNDEVRLALSQIDREIRSGNVFYDPADEDDPSLGLVPNMSMRVYTQSNATTRDEECAQWRIKDGQLQTRLWVKDDMTPKGWRVVAEDIVNEELDPPVPAFVRDTSSAGRTMRITIVVDRPDDAAKPERLELSITGRNTSNVSYNEGACAMVPPVT